MTRLLRLPRRGVDDSVGMHVVRLVRSRILGPLEGRGSVEGATTQWRGPVPVRPTRVVVARSRAAEDLGLRTAGRSVRSAGDDPRIRLWRDAAAVLLAGSLILLIALGGPFRLGGGVAGATGTPRLPASVPLPPGTPGTRAPATGAGGGSPVAAPPPSASATAAPTAVAHRDPDCGAAAHRDAVALARSLAVTVADPGAQRLAHLRAQRLAIGPIALADRVAVDERGRCRIAASLGTNRSPRPFVEE